MPRVAPDLYIKKASRIQFTYERIDVLSLPRAAASGGLPCIELSAPGLAWHWRAYSLIVLLLLNEFYFISLLQ